MVLGMYQTAICLWNIAVRRQHLDTCLLVFRCTNPVLSILNAHLLYLDRVIYKQKETLIECVSHVPLAPSAHHMDFMALLIWVILLKPTKYMFMLRHIFRRLIVCYIYSDSDFALTPAWQSYCFHLPNHIHIFIKFVHSQSLFCIDQSLDGDCNVVACSLWSFPVIEIRNSWRK